MMRPPNCGGELLLVVNRANSAFTSRKRKLSSLRYRSAPFRCKFLRGFRMSKQVTVLSSFAAAIVVYAVAQPAMAEEDTGFFTTPTRTLSNSTVVNASVTAQGHGTGDIR